MKGLHHEVDELRKSGALKEALDLARYAHSKTPKHKLLKRSYSWSVYSYLKHKVSSSLEELRQGQLTSGNLVSANKPRVIELNQLCREYRVQRLLTSDLCFSLILRTLCRLTPPPLGLYGLLKWARSAGLRSEDYQAYEGQNSTHQNTVLHPPLILLLARGMESMTVAIDQCDQNSPALAKLDDGEVASLTAKVYLHANDSLSEDARSSIGEGELSLLWRALWLSRRAGDHEQGLTCALELISKDRSLASTWWELAQCLARYKRVDPYKMTLKGGAHSSHNELKTSYYCALKSISLAQANGLGESKIVIVYAQAAYWAHSLGLMIESQVLLSRAIQLLESYAQPIPYSWVRDLSHLGGSSHHLNEVFEGINDEIDRYLASWLSRQKTGLIPK